MSVSGNLKTKTKKQLKEWLTQPHKWYAKDWTDAQGYLAKAQ